jgi:hypothetical protein
MPRAQKGVAHLAARSAELAPVRDEGFSRGLLRQRGPVVLAASDPVAAWGGLELLRHRHGLETTVVTGPATDNAAGTKLVEAQTGLRARNDRSTPNQLAKVVVDAVGLTASWKEPGT